MPKRKRIAKGQRKFIRREKARIRRSVLSLPKREEEIKKLGQRFGFIKTEEKPAASKEVEAKKEIRPKIEPNKISVKKPAGKKPDKNKKVKKSKK